MQFKFLSNHTVTNLTMLRGWMNLSLVLLRQRLLEYSNSSCYLTGCCCCSANYFQPDSLFFKKNAAQVGECWQGIHNGNFVWVIRNQTKFNQYIASLRHNTRSQSFSAFLQMNQLWTCFPRNRKQTEHSTDSETLLLHCLVSCIFT